MRSIAEPGASLALLCHPVSEHSHLDRADRVYVSTGYETAAGVHVPGRSIDRPGDSQPIPQGGAQPADTRTHRDRGAGEHSIPPSRTNYPIIS